jgi:ribosome-binding factor A
MTRRVERLNHLIRNEITDLLRREVKDPRLGVLVTVTQVSTTPDLRHARVFISVMGTDDQKTGAMAALQVAAGFVRRELSHRLRLRYTPELSFCYDDTMEEAGKVLQLIHDVSSESGGQEPGEC